MLDQLTVDSLDGDVVAVFEVADKNLRVLDAGSGRLREELRLRLPGGDRAVARGKFFSFHRVNGAGMTERLLQARLLEYRRVLVLISESGRPPRFWQLR